MNAFCESLRGLFRGDVVSDEELLTRYSRDASLFVVRPTLIVCPRDARDVEILVVAASAAQKAGNKISLTARAAGTDMSGGPLTESVVVDFSRYMNHVRGVEGILGKTEPGVFYRDFEKVTLEKNLLMPSYPASRELCAIGGIVANNAGGEKSLVYGKTADYVHSLNVVLADGHEYELKKLTAAEFAVKQRTQTFEGEIYRKMGEMVLKNKEILSRAKPTVSKNSAGYALWDVLGADGSFDLTRLFVGSQGTLGLVTEATFRLVKPKTHARTLVIFLNDMQRLAELVNALLLHKPESLESYDDKTMAIAIKYFGDIVKRLKGNIITLGIDFLPEFWAVLTGGMPKLIIIAEFTADSDEEAFRAAKEAEAGIASFKLKTHVTKTKRESEKYWVVRRESFSLLRKHAQNLRTAPFIDDIVVRPEKLPEFLPRLYKILDEYKDKMIYTVAGHIGDGNFHIIPLMDLSDHSAGRTIEELAQKVYDLVFEYGGSMTGEHNDGIVRSVYLPQMFGGLVFALFEETKKIFDPTNLFNPGKKVGATIAYEEAHFDITSK